MTEQEKRANVIAELERVADEANPWKESPPLRCDISYPLLIDALTLLKAREPRMMTLDEVCKGLVWLDTYRTSEVEPVYILEMNKRGEIYYLVFGTGARPMLYDEDYNKEYRFWTSRPTDEQREAIPWN